MSLPSQFRGTGRRTGGVGHVGRGTRRRRSGLLSGRTVTGAAVVLVGAGVVWGALVVFGGPRTAPADEPGVNDPLRETSVADTIDQPGRAAPVTIANGRSRPEDLIGSNTRPPPLPDAGTSRHTTNTARPTPSGGLLGSAISEAVGTNTPHTPVASGRTNEVPNGSAAGSTVPAPQRTLARSEVEAKLAQAEQLVRSSRSVEARALLSDLVRRRDISEADRAAVRTMASELNEVLVFGPRVYADDPMAESYTVQSGDSLARIAARRDLGVDWRLIQRINGLSNPNRIRVGQSLKLIRGPFHVVVDKSAFRLDLYHGAPDDPSRWTYIRSFNIGIGRNDATPVGTFVVMRDSKVVNPAWVNPTNGAERYGRDDPDNPIGEYWIGIRGLGDAASYVGFGLHGTIEPDSIGGSESLGCVRLGEEDIALLYELLAEDISVVHIVP